MQDLFFGGLEIAPKAGKTKKPAVKRASRKRAAA
jgi:hypothetical protein